MSVKQSISGQIPSHPSSRVPTHPADPVRPRHRAASLYRRAGCVLLLALASLLTTGVGRAQSASEDGMRSLDEQVQEIKADVLAIAAELGNLEERLLYPSSTQVAVFVSLAEGDALGLDSVQIHIDGELVAHHIYSFKELAALQKGGVQRIYTGNVRTGEHRLEVSIAGRSSGGQDFAAAESFVFTKEIEPKLVGIELTGQASGDAAIAVGDW